MFRYVILRLLGAIPTMFLIIVMCFFMMRIAPGGPFTQERSLPPEIEKNVLATYDLDKPLIEQFISVSTFVCGQRFAMFQNGGGPDEKALAARGLKYVDGAFRETKGIEREVLCFGGYFGKLLQGDFGPSYKKKDQTVAELIAAGAPVSITLGLSSISLAAIIGLFLGIFAALNQNRSLDFSIMTIAMLGITIPSFVMAPILQLIFGIHLRWLPVATWGGIDHAIMPIFALALPQIAVISRLMRGGMIEVMRSNYVRTARAKGLPERIVIGRHALQAAMLPMVSYLGPATAALLTGSLVVETIFGLPGIGQYFVKGALERDYTLVMGVIVLFAGLVIMLNLAADVIYGVLDPKVRYD